MHIATSRHKATMDRKSLNSHEAPDLSVYGAAIELFYSQQWAIIGVHSSWSIPYVCRKVIDRNITERQQKASRTASIGRFNAIESQSTLHQVTRLCCLRHCPTFDLTDVLHHSTLKACISRHFPLSELKDLSWQ